MTDILDFYLKKQAFWFFIGVSTLIGSIVLTVYTTIGSIQNKEALLFADYMKQFLAMVFSGSFGYIATEYKKLNEIDKIAKRANEKIVKSCSEMIQIAQDVENQMQKNSSDHYQVIIENFAQNLRNLGKRNITLANDWISVTSDKLAEELGEIAKDFESLESKKDEYKQLVSINADQDQIDALESQIKAKVEKLEARSYDVQGVSTISKIANISSVDCIPLEINDEKFQKGKIVLEVFGDSKLVTASGKLIPKMIGVPEVTARIISSPKDSEQYTIHAKAGTNFDFHIHMKHSDNFIKHGRYEFEYIAKVL